MAWELNVKNEIRPCYVRMVRNENKKALFHGWNHSLNSGTRAIVELENGCVTTVIPECVQFLDNKFADYAWEENTDE